MRKRSKNLILLILGLVLSGTFFYLHRPHEQPILPVAGYHYYLSRQIYRGDVLYRDMFIDKPPLTELIGAGCFLVGSGKLFPSVILTRWVFFLFHLFAAIPLFIISRYFFRKVLPAFLVVLTYLSFSFPYEKLAVSADWHVPMVFFGLFSLVFFIRGRFFWAGLFASLSVLSWQPGLIFPIAILLAIAFSPPGSRFQRTALLLGAFLLPLGAVFLYSYLRGSLTDLVEQTILYGRINVSSEFLFGLRGLPRRIAASYSRSVPIMFLGMVGCGLGWFRLMKKKEPVGMFLIPLSLLTMMIVVNLVDSPSSRHLIPALPWISFFAVFFLERLHVRLDRRYLKAAPGVILAVLIGYSLIGTLEDRPALGSMEKQQRYYLNFLKRNGYRDGDSILCLESVLPALFAGRKNPGRHVYCLEEKHYRFIEIYQPGGFASIMSLIREKDPRLVYIGKYPWSRRDWSRKRYDPLRKFLGRRYELVETNNMWLYRKR